MHRLAVGFEIFATTFVITISLKRMQSMYLPRIRTIVTTKRKFQVMIEHARCKN